MNIRKEETSIRKYATETIHHYMFKGERVCLYVTDGFARLENIEGDVLATHHEAINERYKNILKALCIKECIKWAPID